MTTTTHADLLSRREAITADLMSHPERRGTAWYDDRVREVEGLRDRMARVRDDADADTAERDARELLTAKRAIMAGLASAREWGAPMGRYQTA